MMSYVETDGGSIFFFCVECYEQLHICVLMKIKRVHDFIYEDNINGGDDLLPLEGERYPLRFLDGWTCLKMWDVADTV